MAYIDFYGLVGLATREVESIPVHCPKCGRFAKMGREPGKDHNGEYEWTVICKAHGEQWCA